MYVCIYYFHTISITLSCDTLETRFLWADLIEVVGKFKLVRSGTGWGWGCNCLCRDSTQYEALSSLEERLLFSPADGHP